MLRKPTQTSSLACAAFIAIVWAVFAAIQNQNAGTVLAGFRAAFRSEIAGGNGYVLAQSVSDFARLGLVRCARLQGLLNGAPGTFMQTAGFENCRPSLLFLNGSRVLGSLDANSGQTWQLEFVSRNPPWFGAVFLCIASLGTAAIALASSLAEKRKHLRETVLNAKRDQFVALQRLAASVAHDIRSPLGALNVVASSASDMDPDVKEILTTAIQRVRSIADELLTNFKRHLENPSADAAPASTARPKPLRLNEVVTTLVSLKKEKEREWQARAPEITLTLLDSPSDINETPAPPRITAPTLSRVVSNLINNSIEAYQNSQKPRVELRLTSKNNRLGLLVVDRAGGIGNAALEQLFTDGATVGKAGGTGLGLSSAKRALRDEGGDLLLAHTGPEGTQFEIRL